MSGLVDRLAAIRLASTSGRPNCLEMISNGHGEYADVYRLTPYAINKILNVIVDELAGKDDSTPTIELLWAAARGVSDERDR